MKPTKWILIAGSLNAALAVILGAFGAHGLKTQLDTRAMEIFQTAVDYHFIHALGLLIIGTLTAQIETRGIKISAGLLIAGIIIFCGSLYLLSVTGLRWLGAITPIGGLILIIGWIVLTITLLRAPFK
jgi:uncharacterized membrane protein YgdD (TMEM256/DUF423 family)